MITMNTKNLLLLASLTLAMPLTAQTPQEDFKRDITLSGSNYVAILVCCSIGIWQQNCFRS